MLVDPGTAKLFILRNKEYIIIAIDINIEKKPKNIPKYKGLSE